MLLILISFIAGVLTVLAPCILPLLPVIVGGSVADGQNKNKPYVIIGSLIISIVAFTLLLKWSTAFIMVPPAFWQILSGTIIILVSLTMLFPSLWDRLRFVNKISIKSNKVLGAGYQKKSFWGDVVVGAALGPVFASCSPTYFVILATVLPQSFIKGLADLFAYSLGLGLVLLLISLLGQKLVGKLGGISDPRGRFKKTLGAIFFVVGLFVLTGIDKVVETELISRGFTGLSNLEIKLLGSIDDSSKPNEQNGNSTDSVATTTDSVSTSTTQTSNKPQMDIAAIKLQKAGQYKKYQEIVKPGGFVNTNGLPITIGQYVGEKVILLDIMTYSCINCQRTFPYANSWYEKYEDKGLIIIGIHTPEFAFEKNIKNVEAAMQKFGIKFPIVLDNDYGTWNAYGNNYWPRKYLIDIDGYIVYDHIGEGEYDKTEAKIIELLKERADRFEMNITIPTEIEKTKEQNNLTNIFNRESPESYLGSARSQFDISVVAGCSEGACTYQTQEAIPRDRFGLVGIWNKQPEYVELTEGGGTIKYHFNAKKVYLVAEAPTAVSADIYLDGQKISQENAGADVFNGVVTFKEARLYTLVNLEKGISEHTLEIRVKNPNFKAYAFTFGSI